VAQPPVTIVGSYLSPYVRKVLVCAALKGIEYRIDPIVPFFGNDAFTRLSPVRRIPVWIDDAVTLADSSVICAYLDERHPSPPLLPPTPAERGRARWLEEFADTRMGEVFIWRLYNERAIKPFVWGEPTDEAVVRKAIEEEIPSILDYLESQLPPDGGFAFGEIGLAVAALASFFRNAAFARYRLDDARLPAVAAFVTRALDHPAFAALRPFEEVSLRTPIARWREALAEAGAPIAPETFGTSEARRGVLAT